MSIIENCPHCGGTHIGSFTCHFHDKEIGKEDLRWPKTPGLATAVKEQEKLLADPPDQTGVNMFDVFALSNQIMPIVQGKDLAMVAIAFAMMLGRWERSRKPFPRVAELQVVVSNEIARWASKD